MFNPLIHTFAIHKESMENVRKHHSIVKTNTRKVQNFEGCYAFQLGGPHHLKPTFSVYEYGSLQTCFLTSALLLSTPPPNQQVKIKIVLFSSSTDEACNG